MAGAPDYILKVKAKDARYGSRVGAAWKQEKGISIRLDPGIAIVGGEGIYIDLWPNDRDGERRGGSRGGERRPQQREKSGGGYEDFPADDFGDDEIPF